MLPEALQLATHRVATHWLKAKSKAPVDNGWSKAKVNTAADMEASYRDGLNLGLRTGKPSEVVHGLYLYVIDVDVKGSRADGDEAYAKLAELIPDWEERAYVQSGRGGDSIHIYCVYDKDLPARKLAHSQQKVTWEDGAGNTHKSWAWEIERFGTGKQVAAPPSIHPDTGNAYQWGQELNWDDLDSEYLDLSKIAPEGDDREEQNSRAARDDSSSRSTTGDLSDFVKTRPLGITLDEARGYLRDLDHDKWCFDYEGWLKVGMALDHEFEGDRDALKLWHEFSEKADNYDAEVLDEKWESFGRDKRRRPVRFATLIAAGSHRRLRREHSGAEEDDPLDDPNDPDAWLSMLLLNDKGIPESTAANVTLIMCNDVRFKGVFGRNRFVEDVCITRSPPPKIARSRLKQSQMLQLDSWMWKLTPAEAREGRPVEDDHYHEIRACLEEPVNRGGYRMKVTDRDLHAAISIAANRNPYHPVQSYLDTLEWDGTPRVDFMFVEYLGCADDAYHRQTSRLTLVAAVARVYQPGHKFDFVPILEGKQGIRKSTFIRHLGLHWYIELDCPFDDPKRVVETLTGSWIAEIPELSNFGKSEIGAVKAFFSKGEEKVREAYGRKAKRFLRQSVYLGTTNDREYLRDPTGNRRFWPIQCLTDQIDTDKLKREVPQLWAEAVAIYKEMAADTPPGQLPLYLKGDARGIALELQDSRVIETQAHGWAGLIAAWANERVPQSVMDGTSEKFERHDGKPDLLVRRESICALQIWVEVLKGTTETYGRGNSLKVIEAIRATGDWEDRGREYFTIYGRQRCFKRIAKARRSKNDLLG